MQADTHKVFERDGVWHAFDLADPSAACGELRITYGVDQIADFVPSGSELHPACAKALAPEDEDKPAKKGKK